VANERVAQQMKTEKDIPIFTDGSCVNYKDLTVRAKKGAGGWAFIVVGKYPEGNIYRQGYLAPPQTNQTAELYAVLNALKWIVAERLERERVTIHSDSLYAINGMISQFRHVAAETDFEGEANGDIWREMHKLAEKLPRLRFRHVRGHRGNKYNEMADRMASYARKTKTST
jgi:ribonuclease HI